MRRLRAAPKFSYNLKKETAELMTICTDGKHPQVWTHSQNICGGKTPAICIDFACHELKSGVCGAFPYSQLIALI